MDNLRKKFKKREEDMISLSNNIIPKHLQKSPSQRKSEALRKNLCEG